MKTDAHFLHGESQVVNTSCLINRKTRTKISMFLIKYENLPISFESGGYIDRNYTGRVVIKLTNYSSKKVKIISGSPIGYIVKHPYSIEYKIYMFVIVIIKMYKYKWYSWYSSVFFNLYNYVRNHIVLIYSIL